MQALPYDDPKKQEKTKRKQRRLDLRGPIVLNSNGSMSRIAKWSEMKEIEKENAWRLIVKRNARRRAKLKLGLKDAEEQAEERRKIAAMVTIDEKFQISAATRQQAVLDLRSFYNSLVARFPRLPSAVGFHLGRLVHLLDARLLSAVIRLPVLSPGAQPNAQCEILVNAVFCVVLSDMQPRWDHLFRAIPTAAANEISLEARAKLVESGVEASHMVYGEVPFAPLGRSLAQLPQPCDGGVFYDIGSGTGRVVMGAALQHHFAKLRGVEILPQLHAKSVDALRLFQAGVEEKKYPPGQDIKFINADLRDVDWYTDADVVFCTWTCFQEDLMAEVTHLSERMKQGSFMLTLTHTLQSEAWRILWSRSYTMSWGEATVYAHKKVSPPPSPAASKVSETVAPRSRS